MIAYANYFPTTGRLAQVFSLPEGMQPFKLDGTELLTLDAPLENPADWRVIAGALTHSPIPPRPSDVHVWNESTQAWEASDTDAWRAVRVERDKRIALTDWTQLPDVPAATRSDYVAYRQALRDITTQADPLNISWPALPS